MSWNDMRMGLLGLALAASACSSSGGTTAPNPPSPPLAPQRVYASQGSGFGIFSMPLTPSSTATVTATAPAGMNTGTIAVDAAGNVAACSFASNILIFAAPVTAASTPAATIATSCGPPAFDASGKLYVPTQGGSSVKIFTPPFTSASTPSSTVTGLTTPVAAAFDASGNLYVSDYGVGKVFAFAPPYTGAPTYSFAAGTSHNLRGIALDAAGNLFVSDLGTAPSTGMVHVFKAPLSAASTAAFDITASMNFPEELAVDRNGNLYVANAGASLNVYASPAVAASAPSVVLGAPFASAFGVAIGP